MKSYSFFVLVVAVLVALLPNPDDQLYRNGKASERLFYPSDFLEIAPSENTTTLIVGGGPIGLSLALLLADQGIKCIVVDKSDGPIKVPAAHQLNIRSNEILQRIAGVLFETLKSRSTPEEDFQWVLFRSALTRKPFAKFDHIGFLREELERNISWAPYFNIPQSGTEEALLETIHSLPQEKRSLIDLRYGHALKQCLSPLKKCVIVEGGGTSVAGYMVNYKYAVDATGSAGVLRRALDIKMEGPKAIKHVVNLLVKVDLRRAFPADERPLMNWVISTPLPGVSIHSNVTNRMNVQFVYHPPYEGKEDFTATRIDDLVSGLIGDPEIPFQVEDVSFWRMDCQVAERYYVSESGVFLVGDSAHRFPPTGGLGMNTGVADAQALAWRLGMVERGQAGPMLLAQYGPERRSAALQNSAVSYDNFMRMEQIFRYLGLDLQLAATAARIKHTLWFIPRPWRDSVHQSIVEYIVRGIQSKVEDPKEVEMRNRLQLLLDLQRAHFNSYGLDLGFCYSSGQGVVENEQEMTLSKSERKPRWRRNDGLTAEMAEKQMPEWTFHLEASSVSGCRLPHAQVSLDSTNSSNRWESSLHKYLDSKRFLLLSKTSSSVGEALQRSHSDILKYVRIASNISLPGLKDGMFLLVRPDDHIAWRGYDPMVRVPQALAQILRTDQLSNL